VFGGTKSQHVQFATYARKRCRIHKHTLGHIKHCGKIAEYSNKIKNKAILYLTEYVMQITANIMNVHGVQLLLHSEQG
jgi:hypothetical protein